MKLAKYGRREWGGSLIIAVILIAGIWCFLRPVCPYLSNILTALLVLIWLGIAAFFRDPARRLPEDAGLLVSPADGVVKDIEIVDFDQAPFTGKALRIGIFLSVLNVHVNRVSADFKVESIAHRDGKYLDARHPDCGKLNEAATISGTAKIGDTTFAMAIRQISGAIARRIVCPVQVNDEFKRGQVYGMIKFGSRTELYLPAEGFEALVKIGDPVRGGISPLARKSN